MASSENSVFVDGLLCESVAEPEMGSEMLGQSISELPSFSKAQPSLDSDVDSAVPVSELEGLCRNDNAACVSCDEVTESCTVDRDGLVGEHENSNFVEPGNVFIREWGVNRCCLIESQSDVDGSNRERDVMCFKERGPRDEEGSASSSGDCQIPLEVIPQTGSPGDGIQQDEQRDGKGVSSVYSEDVREVTEEKGDFFSEMKNDIHELVSPSEGCELRSELSDIEACSSPQQEEKSFDILSGPSLEAACEESVVLAGIEADLCNMTSPARDGEVPSEVSYACDLVSKCDWKNEQMDDIGVSGLSSLSTERPAEVVEMKSNIDRCNQILPSQGLQKTLEDLHMPESPSSCAEQSDQRCGEIIDSSFVERVKEFLEEKNDAVTDVKAVIHTQILPVKVNVYCSKEGSSEVSPNCFIENSVSVQPCHTFEIANNSVNGPSGDRVTEVVEMKSNIDECNRILPPEGCYSAFEGPHVSDSLSVCAQENGQRNDKVIDFSSAEKVTEFVEQKIDATTDIKVEIGAQILLMEEKSSNLKEGSSGLSPNSIHEKSVSLQSFQPFETVNNGSSERLDVPYKNDSPDQVDSSTPFDCFGEIHHEGNDNMRIECVSNTKSPEIVALSSRRSGRNRKNQTKRAPRKRRNTSKVLDPLGSIEIVFKAAGRKRSCLSKPARSSTWGLLGNVTQSFEESNRLEVSQGQNQGSNKRRGGQRSGKRNQSGASANSRGSKGKSCASTNLRLKVKVGKEVGKSSFYLTLPEVVDNSASADSVEKKNGIEGNWRKKVAGREDNICLDAPVLDGDLANKDLESVVLTDNSAEDVIENFPGVSSHPIAGVSSGGSVGTSYRDLGTSPDSEVTNLVTDADVEARPQEDPHDIVLISEKVFSASEDFIGSTKRGKKKHKVPHVENCVREDGKLCSESINKEKPSKQATCRQDASQDFCPSEMFTSSTCANASSNSSSDMESSLEPLRLSGETDHGISRDNLKGEMGTEAKTYCNLDTGLGLSKSQSSKTKGLKPPKGRSRGCDSASKRVNAHRQREEQKKSLNKKKLMGKAVGYQVANKAESLPDSGDHLVDGIGNVNSVSDAGMDVPNLDMVPVDLDKQYLPPRNAWVLCDDCHKWRRIPTELADIIDEQKCTWTCRDNKDKAFADCSIPQEKSNSEINAELDISDASGDEDASGTRLNYKELECRRPTVSQQNVASIKMNQFLHRSRKTQTIDEIMVCHCKPPSDGKLGCGDDCLNRMLNIECIRGACPCRDLCSNQQFQKRRYAKLEKFRSGKKGFGLRLLEDISTGQFLIEYVGEVLDTNAYEGRQKEYALKGHRHFYFMTLNGSEVIDACAKGNLGRFINHSCDPNCRTEKWMVNGEICIGLFALRDIKKGEEVTFDYNYVRVFGAAAKKCYCGSALCRGYIGGDPLDTEVIVQDDSDEEYVEPVMIPEDGVSEGRWDNTLPRALGGVAMQSVESVSTNKETDKSTISVRESEFTTQREESVNRSESIVSHIHDSSSVQPVEVSQQTEDESSRPMSVQQEILKEKETTEKSSNSFERLDTSPVKVLGKSLSDGIGADRKSKSDNTEDMQVSSKVRPNVKTSRSSSSVKKDKVRITPNGNKIQVATNKSHMLSIKPKRLTEGSVEEKLNELLDGDGGINKRKDSTKGYLKLLFLTAVSVDGGNGEAIQSNRDLSMILDALLKTKSRMVLIDVINKNGLRMLHNIMKKCREDFKKIPILRKLLKVLEYLAVRQILTVEHITGGPPCPGMESFMESMLSLTEHKDKQAHQIARSFRDRWIPRPFRRHNRDDSKMEFNRGSTCNRFSTSHDNWRDQSGRSTEAVDSVKQSVLATASVSTGVQESCSVPSTGGCPTSMTKVRKRKSRWDQPAETNPDSSSLQNKEQKSESGFHRQLELSPLPVIGEGTLHQERVSEENGNCSSSVHDNGQQIGGTQINLEDVPPGFSAYLNTPVMKIASPSFCPLKCPDAAVRGHPQEKFVSRLPVSYGIPLSIMQQYGPPDAEAVETWVVAPGIPFHPFPPLPPVPRHKKDSSLSHSVNNVSANQPAEGQQERCVPATFHSEERTPSTTGANQANFDIPCANNQYISKRARGLSNDLGRKYFKQQKYWNNTKLRPPSFGDRNEWGFNGNNSSGGTSSVGVGNVANELRTSYCSEDLSHRVERAGNNVDQHLHHL